MLKIFVFLASIVSASDYLTSALNDVMQLQSYAIDQGKVYVRYDNTDRDYGSGSSYTNSYYTGKYMDYFFKHESSYDRAYYRSAGNSYSLRYYTEYGYTSYLNTYGGYSYVFYNYSYVGGSYVPYYSLTNLASQ